MHENDLTNVLMHMQQQYTFYMPPVASASAFHSWNRTALPQVYAQGCFIDMTLSLQPQHEDYHMFTFTFATIEVKRDNVLYHLLDRMITVAQSGHTINPRRDARDEALDVWIQVTPRYCE